MSTDEISSENELEWENRVLCSDESCIGVIGPDGRCKECGLPFEGELPTTFHESPSDQTSSGQAQAVEPLDPQSNPGGTAKDESPVFSSGDDWDQRTLCSDESCIGVIGPDGRCKECGLPYKG